MVRAQLMICDKILDYYGESIDFIKSRILSHPNIRVAMFRHRKAGTKGVLKDHYYLLLEYNGDGRLGSEIYHIISSSLGAYTMTAEEKEVMNELIGMHVEQYPNWPDW
jgi:hypothetical protein